MVRPCRRGLSPEQIDEAVRLYEACWPLARIGERMGADPTTMLTKLGEGVRGCRTRTGAVGCSHLSRPNTFAKAYCPHPWCIRLAGHLPAVDTVWVYTAARTICTADFVAPGRTSPRRTFLRCAGNDGLGAFCLDDVIAGRKLQGGLWIYGLCKACNEPQAKYDLAYGEFATLLRPLCCHGGQLPFRAVCCYPMSPSNRGLSVAPS